MDTAPGQEQASAGSELTSPQARAAHHPALVAYRVQNRRAMTWYAIAIVVVLLIAAVAVKVAYLRGEITHVHAAAAPTASDVPTQPTARALNLAWSTDETAAGGDAAEAGIVVTYSAHTVNGRDALSGRVRWHYTRSDETICSVLQQSRSTIAIYNRHGNCDEVTGFVTASGEPKFYRTLTDNGLTSAASAPNVVLTVGAHSVHVFDNAGGLDRWSWIAPDGCAVRRALGGQLGVLISMDCGSVHKLVLRQLIEDSERWTITVPTAMVPIAAAAFVGAIDPSTGELVSYTAAKGAATQTGRIADPDLAQSLSRLPQAATTVDGGDTNGQEIESILLDRLYALSLSGTVAWSAAATGAPSTFADQVVGALSGDTAVTHRLSDGAVQASISLTPAPAGPGRLQRVGSGLLLAGAGTRMYE